MPSSDPETIPRVLKLLRIINPLSIMDVGAGNGRYGFLFRESLDFDFDRMVKDTWKIQIDGIEICEKYITPVHQFVYNHIFIEDWLSCNIDHYDLIFIGDVLEHFQEGDWQRALMKAKKHSKTTIVVSPNWNGSITQGAWGGNEYEKHRVELSPAMIGGKCVFANSKAFICVFDNAGTGLLDKKDILL